MLQFTEIVYLAAPFGTPEERAFNDRLAEQTEAYNYPLFMPQRIAEDIRNGNCPFLDIVQEGKTVEQILLEVCMEALNRSNLVIAVHYGEEFDPVTAFEVGFALGRRLNVIAVKNDLNGDMNRKGVLERFPTPHVCQRMILTPAHDEEFPDRLIPIMNRYFVPHKL